jgi:hypothetical protein
MVREQTMERRALTSFKFAFPILGVLALVEVHALVPIYARITPGALVV